MKTKLHPLLHLCFPSSISPEGSLNLSSVSTPSPPPSSHTDNKAVLPFPIPHSCAEMTYRLRSDLHIQWPYFPLLLTAGTVVISCVIIDMSLFQHNQPCASDCSIWDQKWLIQPRWCVTFVQHWVRAGCWGGNYSIWNQNKSHKSRMLKERKRKWQEEEVKNDK